LAVAVAAAAALAAVPAAAADFFILFSHLPPRSFLHGGIFLPSEIKFPL
jgi:hypothetical protein